MKRHILYTLMLVIMLSLFVQCQKNETPQPTPNTDSRAQAIDFTLVGLDGIEYTLSGQKGRVVFVDFWATWCPPCVKEIPHLRELQNKFSEEDFVLWGVGLDEEGKLRAFAEEHGITYPILVGNQSVGRDYDVQGIPTSVLFDKQNRIAFKHVGFADGMEKDFEREVEQLLNE
jgi:peroxiredoxin